MRAFVWLCVVACFCTCCVVADVQGEIRSGQKTLALQVRHLTFICRRFQKSNIGPFAHRNAAAAAAAATSTLANKPVDEEETILLINLMVAFSNVVSLRVEVGPVYSHKSSRTNERVSTTHAHAWSGVLTCSAAGMV